MSIKLGIILLLGVSFIGGCTTFVWTSQYALFDDGVSGLTSNYKLVKVDGRGVLRKEGDSSSGENSYALVEEGSHEFMFEWESGKPSEEFPGQLQVRGSVMAGRKYTLIKFEDIFLIMEYRPEEKNQPASVSGVMPGASPVIE